MAKQAKVIISISVLLLFVGGLGAFAFSQKPKAQPETQTQVLGVTAAPEPEPKTTLEIIINPVFVKAPGKSEPVLAVHGQEIVEGSTISTGKGGRAQVIFANHTVTRLDQNTEIVLEKDANKSSNILIKLKKSRIWSRIVKVVGLGSFETESASALASVRGTSYGHEITAQGDKIITTKGIVEGECVENPDKQPNPHGIKTTQKGAKTLFDCEHSKIKNEPINEKDKEDEWFKFNQEEDKKLNERFGASTYGDEGDVLGLSDQVTPTPTPTPTSRLISRPTFVLIDCLGPDGRTSRVTQTDCDNLLKFWREHPPAPNGPYSSGNNGSSNSDSSNNSSNSNPTENPTATPVPSPTPTPVQYPLVTNLTSSPAAFDGQSPCSLHTTFHVQDPAGLVTLQIQLQIFDGTTMGEPFSGHSQEFGGQADSDEDVTIPVTIPPNGRLLWRIIADGNTQDTATTTEGTSIQETTGRGCNGVLLQ